MYFKNAVSWDVTPCRYCVKCLQPRAHAGSSLAIILPWNCRRYIPPKRRFTQDLHGASSQKTAIFIVTAMKTSNLATDVFICVGSDGWNCRPLHWLSSEWRFSRISRQSPGFCRVGHDSFLPNDTQFSIHLSFRAYIYFRKKGWRVS
jgi:hypothetical protein